MSARTTKTLYLLLLTTAVSTPERLSAQSAHEHGAATLRLAMEATTLQVEFASPLANLVGFEHAPTSHAEEQALSEAAGALRNAAMLIRLAPPAGCALAGDAEMDAPDFLLARSSDHHGEHGDEHRESAAAHHAGHDDDHHDAEGHDVDHHDDEDHDAMVHTDEDHDDDHGEHGEHDDHDDADHAEAHADVRVTYMFECATPTRLDAIEFAGFQRFPGIEAVSVEAVGERGFATAELTPTQPRLELTEL